MWTKLCLVQPFCAHSESLADLAAHSTVLQNPVKGKKEVNSVRCKKAERQSNLCVTGSVVLCSCRKLGNKSWMC